MNQIEFKARLTSEGFAGIETKTLEPKPLNVEHAHDYTVCGLVLEGTFTVIENNHPTTYRAGEIFNVPAGRRHAEEIGPEGARVVIGRK